MREINQRRLRYFYEVLTLQSIRRAAEELNTAPSVVTRQIRLLEEEVGMILFERRARGVVPTDAAKHLLEYWQGCQAQQQQLKCRLQALQGLEYGSVRIATSEGYVQGLMTDVVGEFCERYPKLEITVDVLPVNEIVAEVAAGDADIGLAYNPPTHPEVVYCATASRPVSVIVKPNHDLALLDRDLAISDLVQYPLATMHYNYGLRQLVDMLELAEGARFKLGLSTNSLGVLKQYVKRGSGFTLLGYYSVLAEIDANELVSIPINHVLLNSTKARMMVRALRVQSPAATEMLSWMKSRLKVFEL